MRLIGDIGGTKALLGLVEETSTARRFMVRERIACAGHADFATLLAKFFSATGMSARDVSGGCLAVAGPLADDGRSAKLTNLPWAIDADALSGQFGTGRLTLVNDFAAAALGTTAIASAELVVLQQGEPLERGVRLVIGAGTGLGMAALIPETATWRVLPSEGGHAGFPPADEAQAALWSHLHRVHGRVGCEQVVSGPGLVGIYRFLAGSHAEPAILGASDPAAAIAEHSMRQSNGTPRQAMDVFLAAYGAFAGDMALALMARGGVFLAGGIAAKILPLMQSGTFITAFNAKGGHSALTSRIPVHIVADPEVGLKGAALYDHTV